MREQLKTELRVPGTARRRSEEKGADTLLRAVSDYEP